MAIFLGGGGSRTESVELDREFARFVGRGRLVYWPFAMADERTPDECEAWLRETFEPLGIGEIDTWASLDDRDLRQLQGASGLYIGGGNTFRLLRDLNLASARQTLSDLVSSLPIYGGSAGATVLGDTIETICHLDRNDVEINDLTGMRLLGGASVWVHYEPTDSDRVEAFLGRDDRRSLIALPTDAGIVLNGSTATSLGFSPARIISPTGQIDLPPGTSTRLAGLTR